MEDRPAIQPLRVYTREEAAHVLGVSLSTLKRLIAKGHLKTFRPDGQRRVLILGSSLLHLFGEERVAELVS